MISLNDECVFAYFRSRTNDISKDRNECCAGKWNDFQLFIIIIIRHRFHWREHSFDYNPKRSSDEYNILLTSLHQTERNWVQMLSEARDRLKWRHEKLN